MSAPQAGSHDSSALYSFEQAVIGGILLDNDQFRACNLADIDFSDANHRRIYQACGRLIGSQRPCDPLTVAEELERETGGEWLTYLARIAKETLSASATAAYAARLREESRKRQAARIAARLIDGSIALDEAARQMQLLTELSDFPSALSLPDSNLATLCGSDAANTLWLYRDLMPIGAFLITGRPKIGKSWMLLQLCMCAGAGADFLDFEADGAMPGLYIAAEDNPDRLQRRIRTIGAQPPAAVRVWTGTQFAELAKTYAAQMSLVQFLDRFLAQNPDVRFVVLDTEETCLSIWEGEQRAKSADRITQVDYAQTRQFDQLALRRKVFVGLVNHTRKGNHKQNAASDPHELINRTNTALAGCSGSMVIANLPDADPMDSSERRRIFAVRGRDLDDDLTLVVEHDRQTGTFKSLGKYSAVRQADAELDVLMALEELQQEAEDQSAFVALRDIAKQAGTSENAVKMAMRRMRDGNRTIWNGRRLECKKGRGGGARLVSVEGYIHTTPETPDPLSTPTNSYQES